MRCKAAACDALQLALLLAVAHATHAQLLARLLAEAPKETVIVGHSLDLAVKLIEVRRRRSSQAPSCDSHASPPQETKRARCITVVLQPWMLRSKEGSTSFHKGPGVKAGYPRALKSICFKIQDAMIDFAYGPKLNAFRFVLAASPDSKRQLTLFCNQERAQPEAGHARVPPLVPVQR